MHANFIILHFWFRKEIERKMEYEIFPSISEIFFRIPLLKFYTFETYTTLNN